VNVLTILIVCGSVWGLFQILTVVVGWRFTAMRGQAVVEWQDCDVKDKPDWDLEDVAAAGTLVREVVDQERSEEAEDCEAANFLLWEAEMADKRGIRRWFRQRAT
jgi:hypothetical protein